MFQTVRQCAAMAGSDLRGVRKASPLPLPILVTNSENKENSMDTGNKECSKSESEVCSKGGAPGSDPVLTKVHHYFSGCRGVTAAAVGRHHGLVIGARWGEERFDGNPV